MPLKKNPSKAAFQDNFLAEVHAGKPKKQALAIAYSTQRKSSEKTPKHVDKTRR